MAVSRALRRLLRVREQEEEQSRMALESALGILNRLLSAMAASTERDRRGRGLLSASAESGELADRLAGLQEMRAAARLAAVLSARIEAAEVDVEELRQSFLVRRVESRQAATLIQETEARDAIDAGRRHQQGLDEWHRSQMYRSETKAGTDRHSQCGTGTESDASPVGGRVVLET